MIESKIVLLGLKSNHKDIDEYLENDLVAYRAKLICERDCIYSDDYCFYDIILYSDESDVMLPDDILSSGLFVAYHMEYTTGVLMLNDNLDALNDIYCWGNAGNVLIWDMLTELEQVGMIVRYFKKEGNKLASADNVFVQMDKDKETYEVIKSYLEKNLIQEAYRFKCGTLDVINWGPTFIKDSGLSLIIQDEELEDEENDYFDDYPYPFDMDDYDCRNAFYEEDWIDEYYRRKGLI